VIVGNIGSNDRMDFTSIGSVVNLAARLCSSAGRGQILIEESVYTTAKEKYPTKTEEPISVKGISRPVGIVSITPKEL
jgi:adenylate cyclase